MIGTFQRTHFGHNRVFLRYFPIRIIAMSRYRIKIEFSRMGCILALKSNFTIARTQIKGLLITHFKDGITGFHNPRSAYIENANFTTSQEIRRLQRINSFQLQYFTYRHNATHYHTVVHGIHHVYFIGRKYFLYKKITADSFCIITFRILRMSSVANFIVCFHDFITFLSYQVNSRTARRLRTRLQM